MKTLSNQISGLMRLLSSVKDKNIERVTRGPRTI